MLPRRGGLFTKSDPAIPPRLPLPTLPPAGPPADESAPKEEREGLGLIDAYPPAPKLLFRLETDPGLIAAAEASLPLTPTEDVELPPPRLVMNCSDPTAAAAAAAALRDCCEDCLCMNGSVAAD